MPNPVLLAGWFLLGQTHASSKSIRELEASRTRFFRKTSGRTGSGYTNGEIGSGHDIYFPIGRSDVLYYQSFVTYDFGRLSTYTLTKWHAVGRRYQRSWQISFHRAPSGKRPTGTLLLGAFELGFRPNLTHSQWQIAKRECENAAPYAVYSFGEHGDVRLQAIGRVLDAQKNQLGIAYLPIPHKDLPDGTSLYDVNRAKLIVLQAEIELMTKRSRMHPSRGIATPGLPSEN